MKNKGFAFFFLAGRGVGAEGANKVHFRRCASGVLQGVPPGG